MFNPKTPVENQEYVKHVLEIELASFDLQFFFRKMSFFYCKLPALHSAVANDERQIYFQSLLKERLARKSINTEKNMSTGAKKS